MRTSVSIGRLAPLARRSAPFVPLALVVLVPLRVGINAVRDRLILFGAPDLMETLLPTLAAQQGQQGVGAWSRLGLFHPGPAWYYWAAPFLALANDHPAGLILAALALVSACGAVIVLVVRRGGGPMAGGVAGTVVLLGYHRLSLLGLAYPWNPTVLIMPVAAGLVCAAESIRRGSLAVAAAGVVLGSIVAQAHLGGIPLGALIIVGNAGGAGLARWRLARPVHPFAVAGVVVALLLPWSPVLVDQLIGTGNAGAVADYTVTGSVDQRFPADPPSESLDLSVPRMAQWYGSTVSLAEGESAEWGGAQFLRGLDREPRWSSSLVAVGLIAVAAVVAQPRRRWPEIAAEAAWLCRIGLAAAVLEAVVALRARSEFRPYLIAGASGIGLVLWLGVALAGTNAARRIVRPHLRNERKLDLLRLVAVPLAAVVIASSLATRISSPTIPFDYDTPGVTALAEAAPEGSFVVEADSLGSLFTTQLVVASLERRGRTIAVDGRYGHRFSDRNRGREGDARRLYLDTPDGLAARRCRPLGPVQELTLCLAG